MLCYKMLELKTAKEIQGQHLSKFKGWIKREI